MKTQERTECGNVIYRNFSMAGCCGTEYNLMAKYEKLGYKNMYAEAPYKWAMFNPTTLKIFSYTEGDTCLIECENKDNFLNEIKRFIEFECEENKQEIKYAIKKYLNGGD